jgi:serine protease Do
LASTGNLVNGTIAALAGPGDDPSLVQLTAPVQAGNSGGPALDTKGRVVAVVVAKLDAVKVAWATGDLPQNVNFAVEAAAATSPIESRGVAFEAQPHGTELAPTQLAARARAITVRVDCHR